MTSKVFNVGDKVTVKISRKSPQGRIYDGRAGKISSKEFTGREDIYHIKWNKKDEKELNQIGFGLTLYAFSSKHLVKK